MKDEIKEILDYYKRTNKNHFGYEQDKIITYKEAHLLLDYITNLQEKVEQYENPEDMTLFYMWLDEKTKDKMKKLQEENNNLKKDFKRHIDRINELTERNEKAIEYNNKNIHSQTLNNILQGSDKDE